MEITQRAATSDDASILLTWRNDSRVREISLSPALISRDEHLVWFSSRFDKQSSEPFLFFEVDGKTVGMARLDLVSISSDKFEISILVDPNFQGKGVGARILSMICETFFDLFPKKTITAKVHQRNYISQKLFENASFEKKFEEGNFYNYEKHL